MKNISTGEALFVAALMYLIGAMAGFGAGTKFCRRDAMKAGVGSYNPTTHVWQWKEAK